MAAKNAKYTKEEIGFVGVGLQPTLLDFVSFVLFVVKESDSN